MPGQNPFSFVGSALFPTATGMMQKQQMYEDQKTGAAQAAGLQGNLINRVGQLQSQGMQPNQIMQQLLQDPAFVQAFSDPNTDAAGLSKLVTDLISSAQAPAPLMTDVAPGHALTATDIATGKTTPQFSQPTEQEQTTKGMLDIATKDPGERANLAKAILEKQARGDSTELERWAQAAIAAGDDPTFVRDVLGGNIQPMTVKTYDEASNFTGEMQVWSNRRTSETIAPQRSMPGTTFGDNPDDLDTSQLLIHPKVSEEFPDATPELIQEGKDTMALGTGSAPIIMNWAGGVLQQIDPAVFPDYAKQSSIRRFFLDNLRMDVANLRDAGGGFGVSKATQEILLNLTPGMGPIEGNQDTVNKLLGLHHVAKTQILTARSIIDNPKAGSQAKVDARKRITGWQNIINDMPSPQKLTALNIAIANHEAGMSLGGLVKAGKEAIGLGTGAAEKQVQQAEAPGTPLEVRQMDFATFTAWANSLTIEDYKALPPAMQDALDAKANGGK